MGNIGRIVGKRISVHLYTDGDRTLGSARLKERNRFHGRPEGTGNPVGTGNVIHAIEIGKIPESV